MDINYYELLGVKQDASFEDIKAAYKKQMKLWHPDINKSSDAIEMSSKINEAKEVLLDNDKRKEYDEYLKNKVEENYNRYTQRKHTVNNQQNNTYENKTVGKWEYFKEWVKYANISKPKKVIGIIGVLLESFICYILRILIIVMAYTFNIISIFIRDLFNTIFPIILLMFGLFIVGIAYKGIYKLYEEDKSIFNTMLSLIIVYTSSYILPLISSLLISPKTFDILYNKIDISLFKKCVGYKN